MPRVLLALIIAAFCAAAGAQDPLSLPDFGSSAGGILTPDEERRLGEGMMRELRGLEYVMDDPLVAEYIETLGFRLVAHSERPELPFTFFVVRSEQINAFAAPGGYIGVNAGLITTAESESELAAVLAHEVAHVTQRHLVRRYERIRNASLPIALAMIGALIAAQGAGGGDAAQAAVVSGSALMQQQQINFTRHNEYEADRIGIHTLARASFDPDAMADFFGRMGRALRVNGDAVPEFLRTHPVTTSRISEAKTRAAALAGELPRTAGAAEGLDFDTFRERARVLAASEPRDLVAFYRADLALDPTARRYGLGLALVRAGQATEAVEVLRPLVTADPGNSVHVLAIAEAESVAGRRREALARLQRLAEERPGNRAVAIAYADELIASGDRERARTALDALRPLLTQNPGDARLQLSYARAAELAGDEIRAGEAHAEVALLSGRASDAMEQLQTLLRRPDIDYYQRARIEARIAQITPWALEQRRRPPPGDV